jgi:hypothetical protein
VPKQIKDFSELIEDINEAAMNRIRLRRALPAVVQM